MAELSWTGSKGSLRLEKGPRGGVKWIIVRGGNESVRAKSPTFNEVESLGLDSNAVYTDYNAWQASEAAGTTAASSAVPSPNPLTQAEIQQMVIALNLFEASDAEAFAAYLFTSMQEQREALIATHYEALVNQMTGQASQEILDRAAALAENAADSLLRTMTQADLNAAGQVISDGIAAGLHPRDIARNLEMVQGLDANRVKAFEAFREKLELSDLTDAQIIAREEAEFQRLLRERRETIANTEANYAVSEGDRLEALRTGARYKVWQTTGDERVSDECQQNEAAGPIPIDEDFPGGVATTPQHVNCRCAVTYISTDEQLDGARERADQRAARTAAAKEEDAA